MIKKTIYLLAGFFLSVFTSQAQSWIQIGQNIEGEAAGERSGWSVNLNSDGSIIAIGAPFSGGYGSEEGYVRIFENHDGIWTQIGQDIVGEAVEDRFGYSVCLSLTGSIVAIGAPYNSENGFHSGHVRILKNNGGAWTQIGQDIEGQAAKDLFGHSVSLSSDGSVVAIGAPGNDGNGSEAGNVCIYENQGGTWIKLGQDINGEAEGDQSGWSVSLSSDGSIVAISANLNDGNGEWAGHVRIFENNCETWTQIGQDIDGEAAGDHSGCSIDLSFDGATVAIGALTNSGNGGYSGHVRVYDYHDGIWAQIGQDIDGENGFDQSGWSVSLSSSGSIVAIGAINNTGNGHEAGQVRIFKNQAGTWTQIGQDIDGEFEEDMSGLSVSLSSNGSIVAIGARKNIGWDGHVRIFKMSPTIVLDISTNGISIYPNPTTGIINIDNAKNNIQGLTISEITGKQIIKKNEIQLNESIDLSGFENGIYLLNIQTENETYKTRIIKR